ncbi:MAG: polysaccharide deacetylase family protein, partial [Verrucomicrobiota bacterium]
MSVLRQLKKYRDNGDFIGNHTCTHPRLDKIGAEEFIKDIEKNDRLLTPLFEGQKFFRFPFLNEGSDPDVRDKVRAWLTENHYRNGMVSADNEDPIFSFKI